MRILDKQYLKAQFFNHVFRKNGIEFQTFFEGIMRAAFDDFEKIKPSGRLGDRKNDGFRISKGIYYQVYAPECPEIKQADAARKLLNDFPPLYEYWNKKFPIKKWCFVFNDKERGKSPQLLDALSVHKNNYLNIEFEIFSLKNLEEIFLRLDNTQLIDLGFHIDVRHSIKIVHNLIESVQIDLDRGHVDYVLKGIEKVKSTLKNGVDPELLLELRILEGKAALLNEDAEEAKKIYESIIQCHSSDIRAILYLAEIYFYESDLDKDDELMSLAESIDTEHWLFKIQKLIRDLDDKMEFDPEKIIQGVHSEEKRIQSIFYRIISIFFLKEGKLSRALEFADISISLNPERFDNYVNRFVILSAKLFDDKQRSFNQIEEVLENIDKLFEKFSNLGRVSQRKINNLHIIKLDLLLELDQYDTFEAIARMIFDSIYSCYLDDKTESLLSRILFDVLLEENDLEKLSDYLKNKRTNYSEGLIYSLLLQFCQLGNLTTSGKEFFETLGMKKGIDFISNIVDGNIQEVLSFANKNLQFMLGLANGLKDFPVIRKEIITGLPQDGRIQNDKVWLLYYFENNFLDEAFEILKQIDISQICFLDCKIFSDLAHKMQAWEIESKILERFKSFNLTSKDKLITDLRLFFATYNLGQNSRVIQIGRSLLKEQELIIHHLNPEVLEGVLTQVIQAQLKIGKTVEALSLLEDYSEIIKTPEIKFRIEAETYLQNDNPRKALMAVVDGVKTLKNPNSEEYGRLFLILTQIDNLSKISVSSMANVRNDSFVKIKNQDHWYYIGDGIGLGATKISNTDSKYSSFIGRKLGSKIDFPEDKYSSMIEERIIENILSIEGYIFIKVQDNFKLQSHERRWDYAIPIEIPSDGKTIDTSYLKRFLEDQTRAENEFFQFYCESFLPFAFLVKSENGILRALGKIVAEQKGYIHNILGNRQEFLKHKKVAIRILNDSEAIIDGISTLFLVESKLFSKVFKTIPNLKVSQSVLNFLYNMVEYFNSKNGQNLYLSYVKGEPKFGKVSSDFLVAKKENLINCIKLIEDKSENIIAISNASKNNSFIEQNMPPEIVDACVLAQRDNLALLTEDSLYLSTNASETSKSIPEYCSSLFLVKEMVEKNLIQFSEYLDLFELLCFYRCKFLPISSDILFKAVFQGDSFLSFKPECIRAFHLDMILSKEYGVAPLTSIKTIAEFICKILSDDSISLRFSENVFIEIIPPFLKSQGSDRNKSGWLLLNICSQFIRSEHKKRIKKFSIKKATNKLNYLEHQININCSPLALPFN